MPTYIFALILYYLPASMLSLPQQSRWLVLGLIFFTTFLIPGIGAYAMVRAGQLDSMEMEKREQRSSPLLFTGLCYGTTAYLLRSQAGFDAIFYFVMGIMAASVFLTYIISFFWKVSAHGIGLGGSLGLLLVLGHLAPDAFLILPIAVTMLLSGAVLSARLALHVHTPAQVYTGFFSGFILSVTASLVSLL
ncbi:hypothetical protein [Pontibacter arcticus]|uniref:PAP2 superfamily protein n=1 Tax=Pontibacter arcticus TaxID=2080288 RepID=A0A364RIR4_9BACT|nr:hypothetical protein [Pontibacter arcticus]RAU84128.1 hypothetical protein DP923_03520 [Pontibacter arcticus]